MRLSRDHGVIHTEHANESGERRRSRSVSSLYIPPSGDKKQTTPDVNGSFKRKPTREEFFRQQQLQQQAEQQHLLRPAYRKPTRAQASGVLPHRQSYPNLEGLTEEQIRMAYEDPEQLMAGAGKRSPYYRDKDGNVIRDEPEHLRAMMEEGIPVKQWIVLLLLLAAGLYKLRKNLLGPSAVDKNNKKPSSPRKSTQKSQKKTGKQKGKKTNASGKSQATRSAQKTEAKQVKPQKGNDVSAQVKSETSRSMPTLTAEEESGTAPPEKESIASNEKNEKEKTAPPVEDKKPTSKKKKKAAKKTQPPKPKEDENLTADKEKQSQSPDAPSTNDTDMNHIGIDSAGETDEWKTVGQGAVSDNGTGKNGFGAPDTEHDVGNDVPKQAAKDMTATSTAPVAEEPTDTGATTDTINNKAEENGRAKEQNGKGKTSTETEPANAEISSSPEAAFTYDDAALALKLQEEEERMAKAFSQPASEDKWAEVTPKKSRRRSNDAVTGPTATAAH